MDAPHGEPLSRDARTRLRELADKAAEGPWSVGNDLDIEAGICPIANVRTSSDFPCIEPDECEEFDREQEANAAFIAASREAVPDLLDEIERLEAKYETPGVKCGRGHDNHLPVALWDCPICTEQLQVRAERAEAALRNLLSEYAALHARFDIGDCAASVNARAVLAPFDKGSGVKP